MSDSLTDYEQGYAQGWEDCKLTQAALPDVLVLHKHPVHGWVYVEGDLSTRAIFERDFNLATKR